MSQGVQGPKPSDTSIAVLRILRCRDHNKGLEVHAMDAVCGLGLVERFVVWRILAKMESPYSFLPAPSREQTAAQER